ncbi:16S rRNA (cytidine(1402)-2'-O)-methyltransferase [Streptococcus ilei]|uniref:16S rRNA (cytidine(1402)-2'-O)-methyltransferase n=1 Tax=Streptococcus TaxID=1301 RepID=UPI0003B936EA|nr:MULTISPECIES: 16S rRNA (cytidine(1402)-2'-O)-methyltransferase [Streptococcus]AGY40107.1 16S rRNA methyltransferase [Streptococcus ilei]MDB8649655.1 16S rRNA (cytidine(1402)-2'-O)-methyltransferase [Streptococcus australis]RJU49453.1 16S rRNA (cytidine(1402)-2'-O)-methyltransferase [Streptococcus sp. AM28-20]
MQIQRSFKDQRETGTLFLVPTPIGNRDDMSYRMIQTLKEVDLIAAEDTRNTGLLLKHFEIRTPQISFHEHNAMEKIPDLLAHLESGKNVAQVSDAGLPSISDPGHDLVKAAIEREIPVVAVPGPSAGITGLIASGLAPQPHIFYGFLPRKEGQQKAFFQEKRDYPETQIFYESPHRVRATLQNMLAVYGDRPVVLVRELTKIYEEYTRGTIAELVAYLEENPLKGECLLIVEGASEQEANLEEVDLIQEIDLLVQSGIKKNQAIKQVAKQFGLQKSDLYARYHQEEEKGEADGN